jgi:hypothetical protein
LIVSSSSSFSFDVLTLQEVFDFLFPGGIVYHAFRPLAIGGNIFLATAGHELIGVAGVTAQQLLLQFGVDKRL